MVIIPNNNNLTRMIIRSPKKWMAMLTIPAPIFVRLLQRVCTMMCYNVVIELFDMSAHVLSCSWMTRLGHGTLSPHIQHEV